MSLALNYGLKLENVDDAYIFLQNIWWKAKKRRKINILINKGAYCVLLNLKSLLKNVIFPGVDVENTIRKIIYMSVWESSICTHNCILKKTKE